MGERREIRLKRLGGNATSEAQERVGRWDKPNLFMQMRPLIMKARLAADPHSLTLLLLDTFNRASFEKPGNCLGGIPHAILGLANDTGTPTLHISCKGTAA